jgi:DNA-directed RNA polymerase specialized sigma subunit
MPGFVRSKKDEARWQKAKQSASKSKGKEESSFTDTDWALVNHIYHKMTKSIHDALSNKGSVDAYIDQLLKIRRHLTGRDNPYSSGDSPYSNEDTDYPEEQSYDVDPESMTDEEKQYSPEEENYDLEDQNDEASNWLRANDPKKRKNVEPAAQSASSPLNPAAEAEDESSDYEKPERTKARFKEMSPERLSILKHLAGHWLDHYDKIRMKEASAKNNPLLFAEGHRQAASIAAHRDFDAELKKLQESQEFRTMPKMAQLKAIVDFKKKFLATNPDFHQKALDQINDAQRIKDTAIGLANKEKQMKESEMIHGGSAMMPSTGMSAEEAAQHAGGTKDEDGGYSVNITADPKVGFAAGNKNFLNLVAQDKKARGSAVVAPKDIDDVGELSAPELNVDQHPMLKHPVNKKHINDFFNEYMPLIEINASKIIKNKKAAGIPEDKLDQGDLNIAGMHGLMQAAFSYDPDVGASFPTHASRKIAGAMNSKIGGQDFLTRQMRSQINFFNKHGKLPEPEFRQKARAEQFAHRKQIVPTEQVQTEQPSAPAPAPAPQTAAPEPKKTAHQMIESSSHPDAKAILDRKNRVDSVKRMVIRRGGENK